MLSRTDFRIFCSALSYGDSLIELLDFHRNSLPGEQDVFSDMWDIIEWDDRPGNRTTLLVDFGVYQNAELKMLVKLCILSKRSSRNIKPSCVFTYVYALLSLDEVLRGQSVRVLVSEHFYDAQRYLEKKDSGGYLCYLRTIQAFSRWFSINFDPMIEYVAPDARRDSFGREGTDEGRAEKNIADEDIAKLFSLAGSFDVGIQNRFYLNALILDVVLQGRINELATLPLDCLVDIGHTIVVKVFSEKDGKLDSRFFPQVLLPVVQKAVEFIRDHTNEGREIVKALRSNEPLDWQRVLQDDVALRYFTKRFVSEWVDCNILLDSELVWCQNKRIYLNPIAELKKYSGSISKAAASLGVSHKTFQEFLERQYAARDGQYLLINQDKRFVVDRWDVNSYRKVRRHPKAIGLKVMEREIQYALLRYRGLIDDILDAGLRAQLQRIPYQGPEIDLDFEAEYKRSMRSVVYENGRPLLEPEDALFVIPKKFLTSQCVRTNSYSLISHGMFREWLSKNISGKNTLFSDNNLIDPDTGKILCFKWHDIRHWMQTVYKKGGLTDLQASLLAGRKKPDQAAIYDQVLAEDRSKSLAEIRSSIREGETIGQVSETYARLRIEDEILAEEYLKAATMVINKMPHGGCSLNIVLTPCPNNLSCFVRGDHGKICNHLIINPYDKNETEQLEKVRLNALSMITVIDSLGGGQAPQYRHFQNVVKNVEFIQESVSKRNKKGDV
jgi:hypothetical protein